MEISLKRALLLVLFTLAAIPSQVKAELKVEFKKIKSGRVAFTYKNQGRTDIFVLNFKDLSIKPIIQTHAIDEYPSWSPDGTKLLYYSEVSGDREIYVANSDGSNIRRLTNSPGIDEDPHWSPDGKQIVFQSERLGTGSNIFIMNADGSVPRAITNNSSKNTVPRWSPRGDEILYSSNSSWPGWDIMLYNFALKNSKRLTHGQRSFCRAAWHPDGSKFAFSYGSRNEIDIWIQEKGAQPVQLTNLPGRDYDPTWTDDGSKVFFVSETARGSGNYQLYVADVRTKVTSQVTSGTGSIRHVTWTPYPEVPHGQKTLPTTPSDEEEQPENNLTD